MKPYVTLSNGVKMPTVGYGTYRSEGGDQKTAVRMALEAGYRLLDTAARYENEEQVGAAIRESGVPRDELFLTSKVWKTRLGYEETRKSFQESLERLGVDYLDLFLIHWPKPDPETKNWRELDRESWRALEELYSQRKVRAIGVSNFLPHHLEALMETAEVMPMVDQLEMHVGYFQEAAAQYCRSRDIRVQAWSPMGRQRMLQEPEVRKMAEKYGLTPAQLLLKFLLQLDVCVIPKSSSPERMRQNLHLPDIELSQADLYYLRCLPQMGWNGEHPDLPRVPV